ncbi:hypothetical protein BJX99DRAFT_251810 [Aspergillus californicus]
MAKTAKPPAPYFSRVTSASKYNNVSKKTASTFSTVPKISASEPRPDVLPALSQCIPSETLSFKSEEIEAFIQGPDMSLMKQSEHALVRGSKGGLYLGQVWAALGMFKGSKDRCMGARQDSSNKRIDDSSPISSQGPPSSPHLPFVGQDSHIPGVAPEDNTLRLVTCLLRHILYFAPPQNSISESVVVEFRDAKRRFVAKTRIKDQRIVAVDDGGLCLRQESGEGFIVARNNVALFEAKTRFQCILEGSPIITDRCFAQMVCEALAARLTDHPKKSLIIIHAVQHYMCFL